MDVFDKYQIHAIWSFV